VLWFKHHSADGQRLGDGLERLLGDVDADCRCTAANWMMTALMFSAGPRRLP
jgi:hypothetical protein